MVWGYYEIKHQESWRQELATLQESPLHIDWENTYSIPYSTTRETKLHTFLYRIFHRLITCNGYLHKIRQRSDPRCNFCQLEDTIVHAPRSEVSGPTWAHGVKATSASYRQNGWHANWKAKMENLRNSNNFMKLWGDGLWTLDKKKL